MNIQTLNPIEPIHVFNQSDKTIAPNNVKENSLEKRIFKILKENLLSAFLFSTIATIGLVVGSIVFLGTSGLFVAGAVVVSIPIITGIMLYRLNIMENNKKSKKIKSLEKLIEICEKTLEKLDISGQEKTEHAQVLQQMKKIIDVADQFCLFIKQNKKEKTCGILEHIEIWLKGLQEHYKEYSQILEIDPNLENPKLVRKLNIEHSLFYFSFNRFKEDIVVALPSRKQILDIMNKQ